MKKENENRKNELWGQAHARLFSLYGDNPPEQCLSRLEKEKQVLEKTDAIEVFAVLAKIREEAKRQNTMIIVSGTTASSFAAWLMGATAVNPLPPHYICPNCGMTEFVSEIRDGFDLPTKKCSCGATLFREGHNIPYQGFADAAQTGMRTFVYVSTAFKPIAANIVKDFYKNTAFVIPVKRDYAEPMGWEEYMVCPEPDALLRESVLNSFHKEVCYGAPFITDKLPENMPVTCDVLMRIDGLCRSEGTWENNGADLVRYRIADFRDIPAFREDIWTDIEKVLSQHEYANSTTPLCMMKKVRKGRYYDWKDREEIENILLDFGLPGWYLLCLTKIKYLFPKAHCVEQLLVDLTCAWYRISFPRAFNGCMDLYKSAWDRRWELSPFKFVDESSLDSF